MYHKNVSTSHILFFIWDYANLGRQHVLLCYFCWCVVIQWYVHREKYLSTYQNENLYTWWCEIFLTVLIYYIDNDSAGRIEKARWRMIKKIHNPSMTRRLRYICLLYNSLLYNRFHMVIIHRDLYRYYIMLISIGLSIYYWIPNESNGIFVGILLTL